eukprot:COSAG05_NODE_560_length_8675_cov_18.684235_2_plen_80_part_00
MLPFCFISTRTSSLTLTLPADPSLLSHPLRRFAMRRGHAVIPRRRYTALRGFVERMQQLPAIADYLARYTVDTYCCLQI